MNAFPLLTAVTFLPLAGAFGALLLAGRPEACRRFSLAASLVHLALTAAALAQPLPLVEDMAWIPALGARYTLEMDGVGGALTLLTSFLTVIAVLVSWKEIREQAGAYHALLFAVSTTAAGVFLARDLLLFLVFWEAQMVPMFFIIRIWGHEDKRRAATKFMLFSIAGGLAMLVGAVWLAVDHAQTHGAWTFSLAQLMASPAAPAAQAWLFAAFVLAFGVKTPMVPVHTWLPDAHTQAPTAGSLLLAGVLLKTGSYALVRWAVPLFPHAFEQYWWVLAVLGVIGLVYASWVAFAQTDAKRLVAYSSVGHMGLVVLGVAVWRAAALEGSVLLMVNHALTTGALFVMVGMLSERAHTRELAHFGGLWKTMPLFSGFFLLFALASAGLPGLGNFVSEMLILLGSFETAPATASVAFAGLVLTLAYVLRLVQSVLFGPSEGKPVYRDLSPREALILTPLAACVVFLGVAPWTALALITTPLKALLS
ncbi:NADH-quinone oxidoreductase subunit M [Fundidesulfovibrio magnetotacticus]|uniref:NADH-quinone oxidoreductase subunit M n=1 Tax=Fundidesulfovibrio magnetotacticus TaxID=2730080 RepID=A0A6V8LW16_9BACT|nr:NADH-quinone oxidoreductase subunit M [Fundidesulfovibrio magnetotacticus]GFK92455.1 NADH-quinone oxidoreductase subunit M [Fundidesulfovibrio magnetotacticus]